MISGLGYSATAQLSHHCPTSPNSCKVNSPSHSLQLQVISDNHLSFPTHSPAIPAGMVVPSASRTARSPLEFLTILYACFILISFLIQIWSYRSPPPRQQSDRALINCLHYSIIFCRFYRKLNVYAGETSVKKSRPRCVDHSALPAGIDDFNGIYSGQFCDCSE